MTKRKFTIIPVPYEATTTYGQGANKGPAAILKALPHVEEFDEELGCEIFDIASVQTLKPIDVRNLTSKVQSCLKKGETPVILGGEHSLTPRAVKAVASQYPNLSVLQLDAHADLRDHYRGRKDNHACVMRRVLEICPAVQVGIRNMSKWCWEFAEKTGQRGKIHFINAEFILRSCADTAKTTENECRMPNAELMLRQLSDDVYLTIDVDVFDPSVVPAVGTPEPGGLGWWEVLGFLKQVCVKKNVVGFDVVELCPRKGEIVSDFTIAKLIYKVIGYISA